MKRSKKLLIAAIVALAVLLILAIPALADQRYLVCDWAEECQINILHGTPTEYPAGEPFYIIHGGGGAVPDGAPIAAGHMGFALEVDGVYVESDWDYRGASSASDGRPNMIWSGSAFNFPEGMTGPHIFTGHWYTACQSTDGPCENPMDPVDFITLDLTVEFVE